MNKYTAKTLDEVLALASEKEQCPVDQLNYKVIEEKRGLFSKKVVIETYGVSDVIEFAKKYLLNVISNYELEGTVEEKYENGIIHLVIDTNHNSILIGKNGKTLQALNDVCRYVVAAKFKRHYRILLDINSYKNEKTCGVLEEDKLFATLDPTTRNLRLPSKQEVLLTDTVGFIRKLPHHLIEAFRSTLEEAKYADIILHVVDASNPQVDEQMHIVYETLMNLEVKNKPIITAFNKQDKVEGESILRDFHADHIVRISAKHGDGLDKLQDTIEEVLRGQKVLIEKIYDYADAGKIQMIRKYGELLEEEYRENGIYAKGYVPAEIYEKVK